MRILDTTLRDGGNVVGNGFDAQLTESIVKGLISCGIKDIELGNAKGVGAYEHLNAPAPLTDEGYMKLVAPYCDQGRLGMFMLASQATPEYAQMAKANGLYFLRVGNNASDGKSSLDAIKYVKDAGLFCRYSLMKAYISTPQELAEECKMLEAAGADCVTIMDSAGTMFPEDTAQYVTELVKNLSIPVGFHGHSNLGLSQANALTAAACGASEIDGGLLGMARSAGNCATELAVATLKKKGYLEDVDLYKLLDYLSDELIPMMKPYDYHVQVDPTELALGLSGCHSSFQKMFEAIAAETGVNLRKLIVEVSALERKKPSEELIRSVAASLKK